MLPAIVARFRIWTEPTSSPGWPRPARGSRRRTSGSAANVGHHGRGRDDDPAVRLADARPGSAIRSTSITTAGVTDPSRSRTMRSAPLAM